MDLTSVETSQESRMKKKKEQELNRSKPRAALRLFGSGITPSWDDKDKSVDRNTSVWITDMEAENDENQENLSSRSSSASSSQVINKLNNNINSKYSTPGFAPIDHATSAVKRAKKNLAFGQPTDEQSSTNEGPSSHKDFYGRTVKDGDFIASCYLNKNNTHDLYCLEGETLNLYMRLKKQKKFIATANEYVAVRDISVNNYIGPIPVQYCSNVEGHTIVEIEHELADVCKKLISAGEIQRNSKEDGNTTPKKGTVALNGRKRRLDTNRSFCNPTGSTLSTPDNGTVSPGKAKRKLHVALDEELTEKRAGKEPGKAPGQASNLVNDSDNEGPLSPEEQQDSQEESDTLSIYASDNDFQSTQESEGESSIYASDDDLQSTQQSQRRFLEKEFHEGSDTLSVHAPSDDEFKSSDQELE